MSPRRIRVAVAQIDYQPTYLGRSFSYLREVTVSEQAENGLSALEQFNGIPELRKNIKKMWIDNVQLKLEPILLFCATHQTDILVFPEYSIPVDVLPELKAAAENRRIVIVAGSHTVASDDGSRRIYEEIGLGHLNLSPSDPGSDIRKSICPIFVPGFPAQIVEKMSRSVWESDMTSGRAARTLALNMRGTTYNLGILLCIDALGLDQLAVLYRGESKPDLLVVPSLSRSAAPFDSVFQLSTLNELPSVYVNAAIHGGSKVIARAGVPSTTWPLEKYGSERLPENTEAVVIAEIDFDEQIAAHATVRPHVGIRVQAYAPLLYLCLSDLSGTFVALRARCSNPRSNAIPDDVKDQLSMLSRSEPALFPQLLQTKIRVLTESAASGSLRFEDMRLLLETVDIPGDVPATFVLRQFLIQYAIENVVGLMGAPDSVREQERIFKVIRNLSKERIDLPSAIRCSRPAELPQQGTARPSDEKVKLGELTTEVTPFFGRAQDLNLVRVFVNSNDQRAFLVKGIKGIGKTAFVRRVFADVLPKWRKSSIQIQEGVSFEQLIAECASKLDIPLQGLPTTDQAKDLARAVLARIDSLDAVGLVLDDCDNLLGPSGDFADEETKRFLQQLISRPTLKNAKVFLISNTSLPLAEVSQQSTMHRELRALEPRDARNMLEYWIRVQREEVRGQPIEIPEKLISFLHGHPLAIKIAARLCTSYTTDQLVGDISIFKKLRAAIVEVLLDKIILTPTQRALLEFASIFRSGIALELFRKWGGDAALLELDSVLTKFLLELSEGEYWMHPAIAHYFYEQVDGKKARTFHTIAADYYQREYTRSHPKKMELLVETIHHVAASGDIERAKSLGIHKEQLRALARAAYDRRDWESSIRYYEAITRIDPKDLDSLAHMALLLGRLARWAEADAYFERATKLTETGWILQSYGSVKVNGGLMVEGEKLLLRALDLNNQDSATLAGLAMLRLRQNREYEADKLFKEALESNPENSFALLNYSRFLIAHGRKQEAKPYAELLVELEPRNEQAWQLLTKAATPRAPTGAKLA